jgi:hypothetical protein
VYYLGYGFILLAFIAWVWNSDRKSKRSQKPAGATKHVLEPFQISATFNFPCGNGHIEPVSIPVSEMEFPGPPTVTDIKAQISRIIYNWLCDQVLIDYVTEELKLDGNDGSGQINQGYGRADSRTVVLRKSGAAAQDVRNKGGPARHGRCGTTPTGSLR